MAARHAANIIFSEEYVVCSAAYTKESGHGGFLIHGQGQCAKADVARSEARRLLVSSEVP